MIIVRHVFQAKPGRGKEVARTIRQDIQPVIGELRRGSTWRTLTGGGWRVLLSVTGAHDVVVLEFEVRSLAEWEGFQRAMFQSPRFLEHFGRVAQLIDSGHSEMYSLEGEG